MVLWAGLYLGLTFLLCLPYSAHLSDRLPDEGDAVLATWIVWWGSTHVQAGYPGILDANAYFPHPMGLAYTEPMLAQAIAGWPIFALTDNPIFTINLIGLVALAIGAWGTHLLLRTWVGSDLAAFVGAVSYAFCVHSFAQLARIQLLNLGWIPLALLLMHHLLARPTWRAASGLALVTIINGLSCLYFMPFHALASLFVAPAYLRQISGPHGRRALMGLAAAAGVSAAVLAWVGLPLMRLYAAYEFEGTAGVRDALDWLRPVPGTVVGVILGAKSHFTHQAAGYVSLAIGLMGAVELRRRRLPWRGARVGLALAGVVALVLSWGAELRIGGVHVGPGPYRLVEWMPLFGWIRATDRLVIVFRLGLAVLIATATRRLLGRVRPRWRTMLTVALALLLLSEHWTPSLTQGRRIPVGEAIPRVYHDLATMAPEGPLAELPMYPQRLLRYNAAEAYFSHIHERPVLFAKATYSPPATEWIRWRLSSFPDRGSVHFLRALGVSLVVVHPRRWSRVQSPQLLERRWAQLDRLDQQDDGLAVTAEYPDESSDIADRFDLGGEKVLRLAPLGVEPKPRYCRCREIDRATMRARSLLGGDPQRALDGRRDTRWTTGHPQRMDDHFSLVFDRPRRVARIEIEAAFPYDEFPRHFVIEGGRGGVWRELRVLEDAGYDIALVRQLVADPTQARYRFDVPPEWVDRLRIRIGDTEAALSAWSIPEIHVFETLDD